MGANLLGVIAVARLLGVEVFGQFAYLMAFLAAATNIAVMNTTSVLAQALPRTEARDEAVLFGNFLILRGATTTVATLLALACSFFIKPELAAPLLVCSLAIPLVSAHFFEPVYQHYGRPWYSVYANIVYAVVHISVIVTVLYWARMPLIAYVVGLVLCHLAYTLAATLLSFRLVVPRLQLNKRMLHSMWVIAAPLGIGSMFYMVNSYADIFMLSYMRTNYEVGIYNAAHKFLEMGMLVAQTALIPAIPILSRMLSEQHKDAMLNCSRLVEVAAVCTLPAALVMPYIAIGLVNLIFGPEYAASAELLGIFAWVAVIAILSLVGSVINLAIGKVSHAYWNTALAAAVNIALNLILIPRHGVLGAAYATLASHLLLLLVNYIYVFRNLGNIINTRRWMKLLGINAALFLALFLLGAGIGIVEIVALAVSYGLTVYLVRLLPVKYYSLLTILKR